MSRFAQIIVECTDENGQVDRQKLYQAISLDSRDPTALIFDAAAFTFEKMERLQGVATLVSGATEARLKNIAEVHAAQLTFIYQNQVQGGIKEMQQLIEGISDQNNKVTEAISSRVERAITATDQLMERASTQHREFTESVQKTSEQMDKTRQQALAVLKTYNDFRFEQKLWALFTAALFGCMAQATTPIDWFPSLAFLILSFVTFFGAGYEVRRRFTDWFKNGRPLFDRKSAN